MRKLIPEVLRSLAAALRFRTMPDYKRIASLPVTRSGLASDGVPFIELSNGLRFFGYLPRHSQRMYYRLFLDREVKVRIVEDCINVACDIVGRYMGPESEQEHLGVCKYYGFEPGQTVVEVGAFTGYYAIRAAELVGESGRVIAIEAIKENFDLLKRNVETNALRNVAVVQKAAWNSRQNLKFYRHARQQASAFASVVTAQEEITVPSDTVDNILLDLGVRRADFVRIQVNGAEQEVLEGMLNTLAQDPKLLVAAIYERDGQVSWMKVKALLESIGYTTQINNGCIFACK